MSTPKVVEASPELRWFSVDDMIWLAYTSERNLLEAHNPVNDIGKPHALGWIDITSGTKHRMTQYDPLTIEPSILCAQGCGFHGFVREGHWVPA